jgi:putative sterol carrier protein
MTDQNISSPAADLKATIAGKSDGEITAFVEQAGVETVLNEIFTQMCVRFLPDKAPGKNAVVQYDITAGDGVHSHQVIVADGSCTTAAGSERPATVTLALSLPNFLRLIAGELNGMQAFMSGALKLKGDMMLAQTMQSWFDQS